MRVKNNEIICASLEDDENKMEIYLKWKLKEIIDWTYKIPEPKDNGGLSYCTILIMLKKRDIINR